MKVIVMLLLLISMVTTSPAQEIYAGAGYATGHHSDMRLVNDSFTLETSNSQGRKFIIPSIMVETVLNKRLRAGVSLSYRSHTISLRGWDNYADTCALCPLKKGGGPTIREMRTSANASLNLKKWGRVMLYITTGVGLALPLVVDTNDAGLQEPINNLFESAGSLANSSVNFNIGIVLLMDRFQLRIIHDYTPIYTRTLKFEGDNLPFKMNESFWSMSILYRVYNRTKR